MITQRLVNVYLKQLTEILTWSLTNRWIYDNNWIYLIKRVKVLTCPWRDLTWLITVLDWGAKLNSHNLFLNWPIRTGHTNNLANKKLSSPKLATQTRHRKTIELKLRIKILLYEYIIAAVCVLSNYNVSFFKKIRSYKHIASTKPDKYIVIYSNTANPCTFQGTHYWGGKITSLPVFIRTLHIIKPQRRY